MPDKNKIKILLVEDNPGDARLVKETLLENKADQEFSLVWVESLKNALEQLAINHFDITLLDLSLPDSSGLKSFFSIHAQFPAMPLVILTGLDDEELGHQLLRTGAQDYLLKGQINNALLVRSIRYALDRKQAEQQLRESENRLRIFLNATSDMAFLKDTQYRHIFANQALADFLGKPMQEIIGRDDFSLMTTEAACTCRESDERVLKEQKTITTEEIIGERYFETLKFPVPLEPGQVGIGGFIRDISVRKRTDDVLKESEARFATIFRASPVPIALSRLDDSRLLDVNSAWQDLTGYSLEEALGHTSIELNLWVKPEQCQNLIEQLPNTGKASAEIQMRAKSGAIRTLLMAAELVEVSGVRALLTMGQDITERRQLEASVQLGNAALEAAANGIVITDLLGMIQWANPAFSRLTGYALTEALGKNPRDLTKSGKHEPEFYKKMWGEILAGRVWQGEIINRRKDGSLYTEEMTITPIVDAQGQVEHFIAVKQDITARKQAEQALVESEARYRNLMEAAPVGIAVHAQGKVVFTNPAGARLIGAETTDEVVGKPITEIIAPGRIKAAQERIQRMLAGEQGLYPTEDIYLKLDGTPVNVEVMATALQYQGQPAVQVIVTDITARKLVEAELQKRVSQLALINEVSRKVTSLLDLQGVLDEAVNQIYTAFGYHHIGLFILDEAHKELVMRAWAGKFYDLFPIGHRVKWGVGMVGYAAKTGERQWANNTNADPHYKNYYPELLPTVSELSLPLKVGNQVLGVMDVQSPRRDAFTAGDVAVLETLADQVAIAVENARLYEIVQTELAERKQAEEAKKAAQKAELLKKYDRNGDGKIDDAEEEAIRAERKKGEEEKAAKKAEMLKKYDKNGDGKIDAAEEEAIRAERAKEKKEKEKAR